MYDSYYLCEDSDTDFSENGDEPIVGVQGNAKSNANTLTDTAINDLCEDIKSYLLQEEINKLENKNKPEAENILIDTVKPENSGKSKKTETKNLSQENEAAKSEKDKYYSNDGSVGSEDDADIDTGVGKVGAGFYDEAEDAENDEWVLENLRGNGNGSNKVDVKSDAQLCCPCCFTIVCMDCQQHVKYSNQYRAVFVRNCNLRDNEKYVDVNGSSITPVICSHCETELGVADGNGVYEFFNVLPSAV